MIQVVIIGSGNVAQHLISAFAKSDSVEVIQAFARDKKALSHLLKLLLIILI
jgi:pyrroline-5-carboxylate reductase